VYFRNQNEYENYETNPVFQFYKKLFKQYNVFIEDEFLKEIVMNTEQNSRHNPRLKNFIYVIDQLKKIETDALNRIEFIDNFKLKECSKLAVFILTETYIKSEVLKENLDEANKLNKEILILLVDNVDILNSFISKFQNQNCFFITRSMVNNWNNSRNWTFIDVPNEANFFSFISELKLKITVCLLMKFLFGLNFPYINLRIKRIQGYNIDCRFFYVSKTQMKLKLKR